MTKEDRLGLGESTTAPLAIRDDSWPRQLERILDERDPSRRHEIINAARPSTTSGVLLARLPALLDRYHPDLAIS